MPLIYAHLTSLDPWTQLTLRRNKKTPATKWKVKITWFVIWLFTLWLFLSNSVTAAVFRRCTARWSRFWGSPSYFLLQHMSLPYKGKRHILYSNPFSCIYTMNSNRCKQSTLSYESRNVTMTPLPVSVGKRQIHTFAHRKQVLGKCWISLSLSTQVFSINW